VTDIKHVVTAAASSSSADRANEFLKDLGITNAKGYGSYAELVADPNVDIIYIATPHSHHYQNAMLCLEANKHVLCEKAFTVNAAQARKLVDVAKSKNLFLMEAVWTRYFPLSIYVRDLITSGKLGTVSRVFADLSINANPEVAWADGKSRMINKDLAGGALLDLGIYALTWVFQTLWHTQPRPESERTKPTVIAAVKQYAPTGVDEMTTMLLTFPRPRSEGGDAHGIATTGMKAASDPGGDREVGAAPAIRIQGDKGECQVYPMAFRPLKTRVVWQEKGKEAEVKEWEHPAGGHGMFWEADEAARGVVAGRKEGGYLGWEESVLIMEVSCALFSVPEILLM
jgi:dihydrodiol dehydrogenase / D-xylose 1-dehydrogenase (NADP)